MPSPSLDRILIVTVAALAVSVLAGCNRNPGAARGGGAGYGAIERMDFNERAAELYLPLFWREDSNSNGAVEPDELAFLTGFPNSQRSVWIDEAGRFTRDFSNAYQQMQKSDPAAADPAEQERHKLVIEELAQGRPTLVETNLSQASEADKNLVEHLLNAARSIERLYARQKGVFGMDADIPDGDVASLALFRRNQSPFCEAPKTEKNPACNALAKHPARVVGLYPADIQKDPKFCDTLAKARNAKQLMDHFSTVVVGDTAGGYEAQPYTEVYAQDMGSVARELEAAAQKLGDDEAALKAYLLAAAKSFTTNDWEPANAAWVAMNSQNSKWYVRVAPDEVYYDPCAWKAGFALQLARINPESVEWQKKLDPMKRDMENALAAMAKAPYKAREVNFKIPDFIDVVLNAGDQRNAHGATVGQSLPNWGPVAEQGGRTVAMTNLYTDADSRDAQAKQMSSMFCKATNAVATTTPRESLIGSLLHEAAHNLGPSHDYKVKGREASVIFGGPLASTLEELKAQTSSMYLTYWLAGKGVFTDDEVNKIQLRNIAWALGHISRGMYAADGTPRNYSQLAAMQLGSFMQAGAIAWKAGEQAANDSDQGCLEIDFAKLPAAVESFEAAVLQIKASGDKARAESLKAKFVDAKDDFATLKDTVAERLLRAPKATFVYAVDL